MGAGICILCEKMDLMDSPKNRAIWLNVLGIGSLLILCAYGGLVVFAYYYDALCDPLQVQVCCCEFVN